MDLRAFWRCGSRIDGPNFAVTKSRQRLPLSPPARNHFCTRLNRPIRRTTSQNNSRRCAPSPPDSYSTIDHIHDHDPIGPGASHLFSTGTNTATNNYSPGPSTSQLQTAHLHHHHHHRASGMAQNPVDNYFTQQWNATAAAAAAVATHPTMFWYK